jgi:tetratricopeptide (TPR) repeat protein
MLSEGVKVEEMFRGGEHLAYFAPGDYDDLVRQIEYYLEKESEREEIAGRGYEYLYKNFSMEKTVKGILDVIDFDSFKSKGEPDNYGIAYDKFGGSTDNIVRVQNACRMMLDSTYPQHHHMFGYRLYNMGLYDAAIDSFKKALNLCPDYPTTLDLLARACFKNRRIAEAIENVNKLSEVYPRYPGLSELHRMITSNRLGISSYQDEQIKEVVRD